MIYGHDRTLHRTGTIDIQVDKDDQIVRVWYRCLELPFRVSYEGSGKTLYSGGNDRSPILAIEIVDSDGET